MAQFKEYVKNDFLSLSGGSTFNAVHGNILGTSGSAIYKTTVDGKFAPETDCALNPSWDDLIFNQYTTTTSGTDISLNAHGVEYKYTDSKNKNPTTIASELTKITPYIVSHSLDTSTKIATLRINAKINFTNVVSNLEAQFIGLTGVDTTDHQLPYTFPNDVQFTSGTTLSNPKLFTGTGTGTDYSTESKTIATIVADLNARRTGFDLSTQSRPSSFALYYKFVGIGNKIQVSDLICEEYIDTGSTLTLTLNGTKKTFTINTTDKTVKIDDKIVPVTTYSSTQSIASLSSYGFPTFQIEFNTVSTTTAYLQYSAMTYYNVNAATSVADKHVYGNISEFKKDWTYTGTGGTDDTIKELERNKALCANKTSADKIIGDTTIHSGASQRYADAQGFSDTSMLNMFNLGIGIVGAAVFISKTYK